MSTLSYRDDPSPVPEPNPWAFLWLALAAAALLAGVFILPYVVPTSTDVISASSLVGFNNAAAYLAYFVCLLPTAVALAALLKPISAEPPPLVADKPIWTPTPLAWAVLLGHLLLFAGVYAAKGHLAFADGVYFQHILARMRDGAVPYRDVNFLYGPAMLYPAHWLARVLTVPQAYFVWYSLMYVAGLYLLYLCLLAVVVPRATAEKLFVFYAVGLFNAVLGMNYVLVRFLLPAVAVVVTWQYLGRHTPTRFGLSVLALFGTSAYSLEMGALASAGVLLMGTLLAASRRLPVRVTGLQASLMSLAQEAEAPGEQTRDTSLPAALSELGPLIRAGAVCVGAVAGLLVVFFMIDPTFRALVGFLKPVLQYSAGGGSRPLVVSAPLIGLVLASVLVSAFSLKAVQAGVWRTSTPLLIALLVTGILMQRPAFGKPDVLHIAYSGLMAMLLGLAVVPPRWCMVSPKSFFGLIALLAIMAPLQLYNVFTYAPIAKPLPDVEAQVEKNAPGLGAKDAIQQSLDRMIARFGTGRPYYLHVLGYYSLPVVLERHPKLVPYLSTLDEAFSTDDIRRVIEELEQTRAIVISERRTLSPGGSPPGLDAKGRILEWLGIPAPGSNGFARTVVANDRLRLPLLEFLNSAYEVAWEDGPLVALVLKDDH